VWSPAEDDVEWRGEMAGILAAPAGKGLDEAARRSLCKQMVIPRAALDDVLGGPSS
jgi:hypothetical protein